MKIVKQKLIVAVVVVGHHHQHLPMMEMPVRTNSCLVKKRKRKRPRL